MIGIFWLYQNKIYYRAIPKSSIAPINGFIDSDLAHYELWREIQKEYSAFYLYEYEEIPRGRVVYDLKKKRYIVYANDAIIDSQANRQLIARAFGFDAPFALFKYDEHYRIKDI